MYSGRVQCVCTKGERKLLLSTSTCSSAFVAALHFCIDQRTTAAQFASSPVSRIARRRQWSACDLSFVSSLSRSHLIPLSSIPPPLSSSHISSSPSPPGALTTPASPGLAQSTPPSSPAALTISSSPSLKSAPRQSPASASCGRTSARISAS